MSEAVKVAAPPLPTPEYLGRIADTAMNAGLDMAIRAIRGLGVNTRGEANVKLRAIAAIEDARAMIPQAIQRAHELAKEKGAKLP